MSVYLVISYASNDQQTFWDMVPAESQEAATARIERLRPHVIVVDVLDDDLVRKVANNLLMCSAEEAEESLVQLEAESICDSLARPFQ